MAKAFDIKNIDLKGIDLTAPLYAGVGVADLAVEALREYVAGVQTKAAGVRKDVTTRVAEVPKNLVAIDYKPAALRKQAVTLVNARVEALTAEAKARRSAVEAKVAGLQSEAKELPAKVQTLFGPANVQTLFNDNVATVNSAYADLAKRGQDLVGRIRHQESTKATVKSARTTVTKAKTTTPARKAATKKTSTVKKASTAKKAAQKDHRQQR
jgi:hypothetical protein